MGGYGAEWVVAERGRESCKWRWEGVKVTRRCAMHGGALCGSLKGLFLSDDGIISFFFLYTLFSRWFFYGGPRRAIRLLVSELV